MTTWVNKYLSCAYRDGGRGPDEYDCWGLVREARHKDLGFALLPSYGALRNTDPREFTKAYSAESSTMLPCAAEHGAIAAVMVGRICVHVALVFDSAEGLQILEINPKRGPRTLLLTRWLRDHLTVTFHRDAT